MMRRRAYVRQHNAHLMALTVHFDCTKYSYLRLKKQIDLSKSTKYERSYHLKNLTFHYFGWCSRIIHGDFLMQLPLSVKKKTIIA